MDTGGGGYTNLHAFVAARTRGESMGDLTLGGTNFYGMTQQGGSKQSRTVSA